MRRLVVVLGAAGLVAVLVIGLAQSGGSSSKAKPPSLAEQRQMLRGSPPQLAALHRQANELLPGGLSAFRSRLRSLRGRPVVVNKWASWCGPCRFEFPDFMSQGARHGRRIAFLGLNSGDNREAAQRFLAKLPVSYPSYEDPHEHVARAYVAGNNYPITLYFDRAGKVAFIHQGAYRDEAQMAADIRRYAR